MSPKISWALFICFIIIMSFVVPILIGYQLSLERKELLLERKKIERQSEKRDKKLEEIMQKRNEALERAYTNMEIGIGLKKELEGKLNPKDKITQQIKKAIVKEWNVE